MDVFVSFIKSAIDSLGGMIVGAWGRIMAIWNSKEQNAKLAGEVAELRKLQIATVNPHQICEGCGNPGKYVSEIVRTGTVVSGYQNHDKIVMTFRCDACPRTWEHIKSKPR